MMPWWWGNDKTVRFKQGLATGLMTSVLQCVARTGFVPVGYNGGEERANLS